MQAKKKIIILGAAGRDYHNFNVVYRDNPDYEVVAFTQSSGQNIGELSKLPQRSYPKELAGKLYPNGIPIYPEERLTELIKKFNVDEVVFAYSDVSHEYVMHKASEVLAAGADFRLLGPNSTMLKSNKPVIAICAVRTGAGKSPASRKVAKLIGKMGHKVVIIRHPMPYGDLKRQIIQRFETLDDLDKHKTTMEEREEYVGHIKNGFVLYAGVDYEKILRSAEKEADIILFEGGNNDLSFIRPDLIIVIADALRPGHEIKYHPGETNVRMADLIIINKVDGAEKNSIKLVENNIKNINKKARILYSKLVVKADDAEKIRNKKILVIEDGPTVTHGGMGYGAGYVLARNHGAKEIIDPRKHSVGSIKATFEKYGHLENVLPAMGYSDVQLKELEVTINKADCDLVVIATPGNLENLIKINKPVVRVSYEFEELGKPDLDEILKSFLKSQRLI